MAEQRERPPEPPRQEEPPRECDDEVLEASEASFPASDAPSWTPVMGAGGPDRRADGRGDTPVEDEAKP